MQTSQQRRRDALQIWRAAVDAVSPARLLRDALHVEGSTLVAREQRFELLPTARVVIVGAGKAGAGMALAVEDVLGPEFLHRHRVTGWVNVPEDCVRPTRCVHLHAARPPGVNEPTAAGVAGSEEILRLVGALGPDDLCLCLISGGGSALMPAPAEGVTLAEKLALTRHLSAAGANIEELNTVRKPLSRIKGGGLARACRAGRLLSLIISDVLGDPLSIIASGPTVTETPSPQAALAVLERFQVRAKGIAPQAIAYLEQQAKSTIIKPTGCAPSVTNLVIGNNALAVAAAADEARRLGYHPATASAARSEGAAEEIGRNLAGAALRMRDGTAENCLISGGEPVVTLVEAGRRGLGGRNQQLVLAALERLTALPFFPAGIVLLSGGTDGEDGPTDAAGAVLDASIAADARERRLDAADYLARNDAYHFFEPLGALIKTGPTHTNVCDVRVVLRA